MITYFKRKNQKSKREKNYKTLSTKWESVDTIVIIGATSTSITLSITGVDSIVLPISAGIAWTLSLGNHILHKLIIKKNKKCDRQYRKDQETIKSFVELYRKSLEDNLINKDENQSLCKTFTNYLEETTNDSFSKIWT